MKKNSSVFRVLLCTHSKTTAFSLVEMLMALLVASLLLAALAPVMTKKFTENVNVSGIGNVKTPAGFKCWSWEPADLDSNNYRVIEDYPFEDIWYLNFIISSGGGGGAGGGAAIGATSDYCLKYGTGKTDTTGHTGSASSTIIAYDNNNFCVSQYNQTASGCVTYSYGGLSMPVCGTYSSANSACTSLKSKWGGNNWRLPTIDEMSKWTSSLVVNTVANGGLYFCDMTSGYAPYCNIVRYASTEYLTPYKVWTGTRANHSSCGTPGTEYYAGTRRHLL